MADQKQPFMPTVDLADDTVLIIEGGAHVTWGEIKRRRTTPTPTPAEPSEAMIKAVTAAIQEADAQLHYSFNLTRLVDGEETYTLCMPGFDPVDFHNDRDEGYALLTERRNRVRAQAVLAAMRAARPAGGREGGA
jgi:hypothetical protein